MHIVYLVYVPGGKIPPFVVLLQPAIALFFFAVFLIGLPENVIPEFAAGLNVITEPLMLQETFAPLYETTI